MPLSDTLRGLLSTLGGRKPVAQDEPRRGPGASKPAIPAHGERALDNVLPDRDSFNPSYDERRLAALVLSLYRDAAVARRPHEGKYLTNLGYYNNKQWEYYDNESQSIKHWRDHDRNPYRTWSVHNLIAPKARKLIARTMASHLETIVSARSTAPADIECASEMSAALEHVACVNKMDEQDLEIIRHFTLIGPCFRKTMIDWDATLPVPLFDENFAISEVLEVKSGDIRKYVVPWEESFPDPRSDNPDRWEWFIHAQEMSLSEIEQMFPDRGMFVTGGGNDASENDTLRRIDTVVQTQAGRATHSSKKRALVRELWHKPSADWPKGLTVWECEGIILWSGDWIYPGLTSLPFVPYYYERAISSPWADSATERGKGPQDNINQAICAIVDNAKEGPAKILNPAGSGLRHDSFRRGQPHQVLTYDPLNANGAKPEYWQTPPVAGSVMELLAKSEEHLAEIMEVQPVSDGLVPAGVTAAAAIQSLQMSNQSASSITIETYRQSKQRDEEITAQLVPLVYTDPALLSRREGSATNADDGQTQGLRLLYDITTSLGGTPEDYASGLEATQDADKGQMGQTAFIEFKAVVKGKALIQVRATSPKDPAARSAEIMGMFQKGMFAPQMLEQTIAVLGMMQIEDSDKLTGRLLKVLLRMQARAKQEAQAMQEQQAQAMQMQQQGQGQALQQQQQARQEQAQQQLAMQAQALAQQAQQKLSEIQAQNAAVIQQIAVKNEAEIRSLKEKAAIDLQMALQQHGLGMQSQALASNLNSPDNNLSTPDENEEGQ